MYYLNKIVGWALSPLGLLFLGLGFAWLLGRIHRGCWARIGRWIGGLTIVLVWVFGCGVTTRFIGLPLEVEEVELDSLPNADAIVLLGGGMGAHEKCGRPEMFSSADRVWSAARLYKLGKAPRMTLSGGNSAKSTVPLLVDFGVSTNALVILEDPRNTEEEAKAIVRLFDSSDCAVEKSKPKVLLVTSAWHMPRAKMLFERQGLEVIAAPTDYEMHFVAERPLEFADFLPNAEALSRNSYAIKEWVARIGYGVLRRK